MGITTKSVLVEAHWSVGQVERAHPILRRAYCIIAEELKSEGISKQKMLQMAVKAINNTSGPDGLVPTRLTGPDCTLWLRKWESQFRAIWSL